MHDTCRVQLCVIHVLQTLRFLFFCVFLCGGCWVGNRPCSLGHSRVKSCCLGSAVVPVVWPGVAAYVGRAQGCRCTGHQADDFLCSRLLLRLAASKLHSTMYHCQQLITLTHWKPPESTCDISRTVAAVAAAAASGCLPNAVRLALRACSCCRSLLLHRGLPLCPHPRGRTHPGSGF